MGGADYLRGDAGSDDFVFDTALGGGNIGTIAGFSVGENAIQLDDAIFAGLSLGVLAASVFAANLTGEAKIADTRIIYETDISL